MHLMPNSSTGPLTERAQTGLRQEVFEVVPVEYLTHTENGREWAHALLIENPFRTEALHHDNPTVLDPDHVVMELSSYELLDDASSASYRLEEYGATVAIIVNISLSGSWL